MPYLYLASFIAGLLLAVRLMFFGAERRRLGPEHTLPLRRSEPAVVSLLVVFGAVGYLITTRAPTMGPLAAAAAATGAAVVCAMLVLRAAIATARLRPEHDPDDPRYVLQGHVTVLTRAIPSEGEGALQLEREGVIETVAAREIAGAPIESGTEVCIERVEDGIAWVERWSSVEARL